MTAHSLARRSARTIVVGLLLATAALGVGASLSRPHSLAGGAATPNFLDCRASHCD